jgi:diguanylate cyclase (GGDEF)-like protein/PAS domain S-box-containing protein
MRPVHSSRHVVLFVLALSVAAIAALGWKEQDSWRSLHEGLRSELQLQSLSLSSAFETSFESAEQTLSGVAYRLTYNPTQSDLALNLRQRLLRAPSLSDLRYYKPDLELGERASLTPLANQALPEWARRESANGRITGFGLEGDSLAFYRVALDQQGRSLGTVYATLSPEYFQSVASQGLATGTLSSCLVDASSNVMMEFHEQGSDCGNGPSLGLIHELDAHFGGFGSRAQDLGNYVVVVQQLRNHPLRVVQIASKDVLRQRWFSSARYSLAAMLLLALAAMVFVRYLNRSDRNRRLAQEQLMLAQTHLQASHDLLDRLSQHVPGVIYQFRRYADGRTTFPYASQGLQDLFGVHAADHAQDASAIFSRVLAEDLEAIQATTQRSARDLSTWQHEFRIRNGADEVRWLSGAGNPMRLDDGSTLWHGFIQDVTERRMMEQAVYEHGRDLNTILENSSVGIVFTKDRVQVWANGRMAEMFGYHLQDIQGQSTRMYYPSQLAYEDMGGHGYATLARGERYTTEQVMLHKDGHNIWVRISGKAVDSQVLEAGSIWVFEDVSEQKRLEADLKLAASVFTSAKEGILITDAQGTIVDVNETFTHITGYSRAEALGNTPRLLNSGRQPAEFYAGMWQSLNQKGHWYGEVWNRRKNGAVYAEMLTISSVRDAQDNIQNYVALFSDITPLKEHQQQLEHIAHYDALTGLPNRVLLHDRLHQAIVQSQRHRLCLAVVFLDLDGFKAINDTHGHAAGDVLLVSLAQHMQAALREGDTLARIGGDEFVAILADLEHTHDCEPILTRLLQTASQPVRLGEAELSVTASMGVTLYPQDGVEVDLLMRQADQAMYAAKQAGKNRYHIFDASQDAAMRQMRSSLLRIQQALDAGEFALHFQPKVNMRLGTVVGAEALIRWHHPERGLLYPAEFLPTIENHALAIRVGEWVLSTAVNHISAWTQAGLVLPISVNISALQLQQQDFHQHLQDLLLRFPHLQPGQLELEVLETSAFEDLAKVSTIITQCQQMGVRFALDDFGTGYSSLTYLKHLPVETLKIDQSFVRDMLEDSNDLAIVNGVIGLARAFGRHVVAEGVESIEHQELLMTLGCDVAQGYGIAKPMAAELFHGWVTQWLSAHPGTQKLPT